MGTQIGGLNPKLFIEFAFSMLIHHLYRGFMTIKRPGVTLRLNKRPREANEILSQLRTALDRSGSADQVIFWCGDIRLSMWLSTNPYPHISIFAIKLENHMSRLIFYLLKFLILNL